MRVVGRLSLRAITIWSVVSFFLVTVFLTGRRLGSGNQYHFVNSVAQGGGGGGGGGENRRDPEKKTYVGNTGTFKFYRLEPRNYSVSPEVLKQCRETELTKCNPPPRRPDSARQQDRERRPPFKLAQFVQPSFLDGDPDFIGCDYDNCQFVGTGPQYLKDADALFVYIVGMRDKHPVPPARRPDQTFFLGTWETPSFSAAGFLSDASSPWNTAFNATITYRLDSDLLFGYGFLDFQPPPPSRMPDYLAIAKRKTRTAVWIVSNCVSPAKRNEYVTEMRKYIDIDVFGKCGEPCEVYDEICVPNFVDTYKFYLSFENTFCTDYITEKFFKLYVEGSHILPVVRGGVDYNAQFPTKSFVNAADFTGPRDLALFLRGLAADDVSYSKYLEVKDRYRGITYGNRYCLMCEYLHKNEGKTHMLPHAKKWYADDKCWDPTDI